MKAIETPRLYLRRFLLTDLGDFHNYAKHPEVGPPALWPPHETKSESRQVLLSLLFRPDVFAIVHKADKKTIGSVSFYQIPEVQGQRSLGYSLAREYWDAGLATEAVRAVCAYAFDVLHVDSLLACILPENTRSKRVVEKCRFSYIGEFFETDSFGNNPLKEERYLLLKSAYEAF